LGKWGLEYSEKGIPPAEKERAHLQGELGALLLIKKASRIDELKQLDEFSLNRMHYMDHPQAVYKEKQAEPPVCNPSNLVTSKEG
jgi:hypothetical protein